MPAYQLDELQQDFFTDLVDLYKPVDLAVDTEGWDEGLAYPDTPTYESVPCLIGPSNELLVPVSGIGQSDYDVSDTLDKIVFHILQDSGANWLVQLKTSSHPEYGTWYVLQGDAQSAPNPPEMAHRRHYMKRSLKGPGIT